MGKEDWGWGVGGGDGWRGGLRTWYSTSGLASTQNSTLWHVITTIWWPPQTDVGCSVKICHYGFHCSVSFEVAFYCCLIIHIATLKKKEKEDSHYLLLCM